ncbi:MAG: EMC3/TMCO1 family protein [Candidatus Bathyarchaeia archaeon]
MGWFDPFVDWARGSLSPFLATPSSTVFVFAVALALSLGAMLVNRLLTDVKQLRAYELEIKEYDNRLSRANSSKDKALLRKLRRAEPRIKMMRSRVSRDKMKVWAVTMVPYFVIYLTLNAVFSDPSVGPVAYSPWLLPFVGREIPFMLWYLICYFAAYTPLSRLFGLTYET